MSAPKHEKKRGGMRNNMQETLLRRTASYDLCTRCHRTPASYTTKEFVLSKVNKQAVALKFTSGTSASRGSAAVQLKFLV